MQRDVFRIDHCFIIFQERGQACKWWHSLAKVSPDNTNGDKITPKKENKMLRQRKNIN